RGKPFGPAGSAPARVPGSREAGVRGQGRDRVQRLHAAAADGAPAAAGPRSVTVRRRRGPRGLALRGAASGGGGRVRRLDARGPAASVLLQGAARRQGPCRGGPGASMKGVPPPGPLSLPPHSSGGGK